uniref:PepSY domain-containing protein n=1 Tax=uncultured bacterium Contigcl_1539 TaxID=1393650 RepID=W0FS88_9BACT|nr:hypothetical protein [uncultured bacterium Contigcl_1539]
MKKLLSILIVFVLTATVLCACGKKQETETQPEQNAEAGQQTEQLTEQATGQQAGQAADAAAEPAASKEPLDAGIIVEKVFQDLHLSIAYAGDIKVSAMDEAGNYTVSFKLNNIDCNYVVNGYTGAIVSKNVPPEALAQPENANDPLEKAVNMALNTIEGYSGGAQNIQASVEDGIITINFDFDGSHYTFYYDVSQEKLLD